MCHKVSSKRRLFALTRTSNSEEMVQGPIALRSTRILPTQIFLFIGYSDIDCVDSCWNADL